MANFVYENEGSAASQARPIPLTEVWDKANFATHPLNLPSAPGTRGSVVRNRGRVSGNAGTGANPRIAMETMKNTQGTAMKTTSRGTNFETIKLVAQSVVRILESQKMIAIIREQRNELCEELAGFV